jgi:folate-dependent phosphoribosylglycinamide formyltransferase PurN
MINKKIIILGGRGESTNIIYNALQKKYNIITVILEDRESTKIFLKRRIKKLGIITVLGQILFQLLFVKALNFFSKKQIQQIKKENNLDSSDIPILKIRGVNSVNNPKTVELIKEFNPDLIIVNGTRIISKKILNQTNCKLINTHVGITPAYRGVHGAYWALVNNDAAKAGVTVHYVDSGIDTGAVIAQSVITIVKNDNFVTYPFKQLAHGIILLEETIEKYFAQKIITKSEFGESNLYYHPTFWQYLYYRIFKGVK